MPAREWRERCARLAFMEPKELISRGRQELNKGLDLARFRLGLDFAGTQPGPERGSSPRFFFARKEVPDLLSLLRRYFLEESKQIVERSERICLHRFDLLGYEDLDYGREIDWHCDVVHGRRAPCKPWFRIRFLDFQEVGDVKITWELNRHHHLVTLAKAYRLTGEERFATELLRQWYHWTAKNPYPMGVNWASSLEVAFRSLSWLWVHFLLLGTPVLSQEFRADLLHVLAISGRHIERYLSTYFSPNTHLLGEGVALFFIGTLCPDLGAAARWRRLGWEIVLREAERQVQADGMHFEQSTYYHVYALDFFLHARILAARNGVAIPKGFDQVLEKMLVAICTLAQAGPLPRFGDDDGGRVFNPHRNRSEHLLDSLATGAVVFGRGDFKSVAAGLREETLWLLGSRGVADFERIALSPPLPASSALPDSGFYVMAGLSPAPQQLIVDAGPQGTGSAGHGHADALSLQVSAQGRYLLIDSGTLEYVGEKSERDRFRGTSAHNTLQVDGLNQAETRGPFGWVALPSVRTELWMPGERFDLFCASHDGYCRLQKPVRHRRWVFYVKPRLWVVRDLALGEGVHHLDLSWHVAAELTESAGANPVFIAPNKTVGLGLLPMQGHSWRQEINEGWWSPTYGRKQLHTVLRFSTETRLPAEFVTVLLPVAEPYANLGTLLQIGQEPGNACVRAYRYSAAHEEHCMFFAQPGESWVLGHWASDAEFLYCGAEYVGREYEVIFCNGTYVEIGGQRIVFCRKRVARCEVFQTEAATKVSSSDEESVMVNNSPGSLAEKLETAWLSRVAPVSRG